MIAPAIIAAIINEKTGLKSGIKKVVITAKSMPTIPKVLPCREVVGEDNPRKARINSTEEMRYEIAVMFNIIEVSS
jgi:hypothetical protein